MKRIYRDLKKRYLLSKYSKIENRTPSLITNNCIGGFLYSRLGSRFDSPTINLQFPRFGDYVSFCKKLAKCRDGVAIKISELLEVPDEIKSHFLKYGVIPSFPFALLDDNIIVCFQHYDSYLGGGIEMGREV